MLATVAEHLFAPALLLALGRGLVWVLPLVSDKANERAVRLAKAQRKQSK